MASSNKKTPRTKQPKLEDFIQILIHEIQQLRKDISSLSPIHKAPRQISRRNTNRIALNPSARKLAIQLLKKGLTYIEVCDQLKEEVGFLTSKSAVGRFWKRHMIHKNRG